MIQTKLGSIHVSSKNCMTKLLSFHSLNSQSNLIIAYYYLYLSSLQVAFFNANVYVSLSAIDIRTIK